MGGSTGEAEEFLSRLGQPADGSGGRSVLIALDGSDGAESAMHWAAGKLVKPEDHVTLLFCFQAPTGGHDVTWMGDVEPAMLDEEAELKRKERGKELLRAAYRRCAELGMKPSLVIKEAAVSPKESICEFVDEHRPDLVVVGSRGHNAVSRFFLGSVSDYVTHHSASPVLVVRGDHVAKKE